MHWQRLNSLLLVVQYSTVLCVYDEVVVRNDQRGGAPADRMKIGHEIWCQDQPIRPGGHAPEDVRLPSLPCTKHRPLDKLWMLVVVLGLEVKRDVLRRSRPANTVS